MRSKRGWAAALGAVGLAVLAAASARVPEAGAFWRFTFVGASLAGCGWHAWVCGWWRPSTRELILWAVVLRAVFLPLLPSLSDDGYRYLWDGMLQREGLSPFAYVPSDARLGGFHGTVLFERMNSRGYFSVYPPVSQLAFRAAALGLPFGWEAAWFVWKGIAVGAEMLGVWGLVRLVGPRGATWYALHPVALVEVAGQAHTEALLIGALGMLASGLNRFSWLTVIGLISGIWTKLWPAAWWPMVARAVGVRWALASAVLGAVLALWAGWLEGLSHVVQSLGLYGGTFDFYAAPYRSLKALLYIGVGDGAGPLAASVLQATWAAIALGVTMTSASTRRSVLRVLAITGVGYVLMSSTLHPWHWLVALWFLPLLQNHKSLVWIAGWSSTTYAYYVWMPAHDVALLTGWGGGSMIAAWSARRKVGDLIMRLRADAKAGRVLPTLSFVQPGDSVLDLGAGEGYVGEVLRDRLGAPVDAFDAVAYGGPEAAVEVYDGQRVPRPSGSYAATVLVYVLHHAHDPRRLLREAVRVTSGHVVVLETVCYGPLSRRWLEGLDRRVNRLRSGGAIEEAPLAIRTDVEWRQVFEDEGIELIASRTWGGLHPQALYVLSGQRSPFSTSEAVARSASSHAASS